MQTDQFSRVKTTGREIDAGLRNHMNNIYAKMTLGVLVTAIFAMAVGSSPMLVELFLGGPQKYLVIFAPLAIIWFGFNPARMKSSHLMMAFFAISAAYGISFSTIAIVASRDMAFGTDVAKAFFIASAMFAGLSIFGYTTKKNLSGMGTFLAMGCMGLFAVGILNMFIQSSMMSNMIAGAGIVLFSGVTVWKTQEMKEMYHPSTNKEISERLAWSSALTLYISFIALFQYILHFLNQR